MSRLVLPPHTAEPINSETELYISHSSQSTFNAGCPKKFAFDKLWSQYTIPDVNVDNDTEAADVGHAFHHAWPRFLIHGDAEAACADLILNFPIQYRKSGMQKRSLEAAYETFRALLAHPILSQHEIAYIEVDGELRPATEVPFLIRLKDFRLPVRDLQGRLHLVRVCFIGYIDVILYNAITKRHTVVDLKTTTYDVYDYNILFQFDTQTTPYGLVLNEILNTNLPDFDTTYLVCGIDVQNPQIRELNYVKTKRDVTEWAMTLTRDLNQMKTYSHLGWWPRQSKSCYAWYRECKYMQWCGMNNTQEMIQAMAVTAGASHEVAPIVTKRERDKNFKPWFELTLSIGGLS